MTMLLNESIVEEASLEWFGGLGYVFGYLPHIAPGASASERDSFREVVLRRMFKNQTGMLEP